MAVKATGLKKNDGITQWYIEQLYPAEKIFKFRYVFVNVCSMMEMRSDQIAYFLGKIAKMARGYFMSKQYYEWKNDTDNIVVRKDDFRITSGFEAIYDHPDEIYPDLFVQIWKRNAAA